jgi:hypothetical protein
VDIAGMLAVSPESGVPFSFGENILGSDGSGEELREQAVDFRPVASRRKARCREKDDGRKGGHPPRRDERKKGIPYLVFTLSAN